MQADAQGSKAFADLGVTRFGGRLVVPAGKNVVDTEVLGERGNLVLWVSMPDDQATAAGAQGGIECDQAAVDEIHPPIRAAG